MPATLVVVIVTAVICVFGMISVVVWAENRRKERESFHQHQTYQKMLDSGSSADTLVAFIQDQEDRQRRDQEREKIRGLRMGGVITTAVGVALTAFPLLHRPGRTGLSRGAGAAGRRARALLLRVLRVAGRRRLPRDRLAGLKPRATEAGLRTFGP